jgi:hypothetical protein
MGDSRSSRGRPAAFLPPTGRRIELPLQPRLASWERSDSPEQVRLNEYLDAVVALIESPLREAGERAALQLDVGLGAGADVMVQRDLDNYLQPLADRLPATICSFWATKSTAETSAITIGPAGPAPDRELSGCGWANASAHGRGSVQRAEWKRSIAAQLFREAIEAADGPLELQLAIAVGPGRNWRGVWKAAIDSLDPILGRTEASREFHPRDDRVVRLALHRTVNTHSNGRLNSTSGGGQAGPG